ncbi:YncE family protein [Aeoliella sp.]|uniref:YncE family protein n=1 Tax=Aeoliella sp. TaxID=2795800 RepID=UPI003CCB8C1C
MTRYMTSVVVLAFAILDTSALASTLIPMSDHNFEHTYDPVRNRLYIPTKNGVLQRYDIATNQLLDPVAIGNDLRGSDITPDGSHLYITDFRKTGTYAELYKLNLDTLEYQTIDLPTLGPEGTYDVVITLDGLAFTTGPVPWSPGGLKILAVDTETEVLVGIQPVSNPDNNVISPASAARSADRSLAIFVSAGTIGDGVARYDARAESYRSYKERISGWTHKGTVAVNRDGSLLAVDGKVYEPDATLVYEFPFNDYHIGGLAFDPLQDVLYVADRRSDAIEVYDTNTWDVLGGLPVGEDIGAEFSPVPNFVSTSANARLLFVNTGSGVRMLENPFAVPEASSLLLSLSLLGFATLQGALNPQNLRSP